MLSPSAHIAKKNERETRSSQIHHTRAHATVLHPGVIELNVFTLANTKQQFDSTGSTAEVPERALKLPGWAKRKEMNMMPIGTGGRFEVPLVSRTEANGEVVHGIQPEFIKHVRARISIS